jgi:hypothetical protein
MDADVPPWTVEGPFSSVSRSQYELSIVCSANRVPLEVMAERGWRCLRVAGPMPLNLIGVLASLTAPLADARVNLFAVSTFDTDYILVPSSRLADAISALEAAGHVVVDEPT